MYNPPLRVAEEFAMLDVMSRGRLVAGMVIGGGPEYYSYQINPTHARERFREALDLIVKAWTTPGPFLWNSKHYFFRYVNPWPRPLQQPHPPIWIPGAGSLETIEFVAQRRYAYMGIPYFHINVFERVFDQFREACHKAGYTAAPEQMGWGVPIYVAETDAQARSEFEPHFWYFIKNLLKNITLAPPGYTSAALRPGHHEEPRLVPARRRRPGTTSRKASTPSSAAPRRCGRSSTTTARSSASASC